MGSWMYKCFTIFVIVNFVQLVHCDISSCAVKRDCAWWEFQCGSGDCINIIHYCDGIIDCSDGSDEHYETDEEGCSNIRNEVDLKCRLPPAYYCDSIPHCKFKIDEDFNRCNRTELYQMRCDKYGHCINKLFLNCSARPEWTCSKKILCRDAVCTRRGDDAHVTDQSSECETIPIFRCDSGMCLEADKFCDGIRDCDDGSDEVMVQGNDEGMVCSNAWNSRNLKCLLPKRHLCDGIDHCDERIDECEVGCDRSFICGNGKCIYKYPSVPLLCNGLDDCGDSSDECSKDITCDKHNVFTCSDGTCLAIEKFCNGRVDCPDGSDEVMHSNDTSSIFCQNSFNGLSLKCALPHHHVCDGVRHCADNMDEMECEVSRWYRCQNNNLVDSTTQVCNFKDECCDSSDECNVAGGCNKTFHCVHSGECIAFERFCDGNVDCKDGSDEVELPGNSMCNNEHNNVNKRCQLPEVYVCDGLNHCKNREDECKSNCSLSFFCNNGDCLERLLLCDGKADCTDHSDEISTGAGFKCAISRSPRDVIRTCVIPQALTYDATYDCRDQSDACSHEGECFLCASTLFYISNSQVCDGIFDCPDASDECLCSDKEFKVAQVCDKLCYTSDRLGCEKCSTYELSCDNGNTCLNATNYCDGLVDCFDRSDESDCQTIHGSKTRESNQQKNFTCHITPGALQFTMASECDGIPECSNFEDECQKFQLPDSSEYFFKLPDMYMCGKNTPAFCKRLYDPVTDWFHCPGKTHVLLYPQDICDGMEDCSREENEQVSVDEQDCHERVRCSRSQPKEEGKVTIHRSMLCDGIIDCEEEEDEDEEICNSVSRFYCENRVGKEGPLFVDRKEVLDGKDDCLDGSDECPTEWFDNNIFSSHHRMIKNVILSCLVWIMAVLALLGNFLVIWHTSARSQTVRRISDMMKSNYMLVCNLAAADFLMGIYLLALAVKNSATSGRYCRVDREWRGSVACSVLGSFAMVSMQSSVMFLLILTTYRMVAVLRPFKADFLRPRYTFLLIVIAWTASILLAVIPHISSLQDYFSSSALVTSGVHFFSSNTQSKNSLFDFATTLHKYKSNETIEYFSEWNYISTTINQSYPATWPNLSVIHHLGYYGTNSVCLPHLFTTTSARAWGYSTIILSFDFCAFIYVVTSYVVIYYDATKITATRQNRLEVNDENKTMQARITRLVVTDFACWVPVCILAFLSLLGVNLGSITYAIAAIVLLPINSALNPILYSNLLSILYSLFADRHCSIHSNDPPRTRTTYHRVFCCPYKQYRRKKSSMLTSNGENHELFGRKRSSNDSSMWKTALSTTASTKT